MQIRLSELRGIIAEEIAHNRLDEAADPAAMEMAIEMGEQLEKIADKLPDTFSKTKDGIMVFLARTVEKAGSMSKNDMNELINLNAMFREIANSRVEINNQFREKYLSKIEAAREDGKGGVVSKLSDKLRDELAKRITDKSKMPGVMKKLGSFFGGKGGYPKEVMPNLVANELVDTLIASETASRTRMSPAANRRLATQTARRMTGPFAEGLRRMRLRESLRQFDDVMNMLSDVFGTAGGGSDWASEMMAMDKEEMPARAPTMTRDYSTRDIRRMAGMPAGPETGLDKLKKMSKADVEGMLKSALGGMGITDSDDVDAAMSIIQKKLC